MWRKKTAPPASVQKDDLVKLYRDAVLSGTSLEKLDQKIDRMMSRSVVTEEIEQGDVTTKVTSIKYQIPLSVRIGAFLLPVILISTGLFLVGNAALPIVNYYLTTVPSLASSDLTAPVPRENILNVSPVVVADNTVATAYAKEETADEPIIIDTQLDYTNLANWFSGADLTALEVPEDQEYVTEYILDIPKLEIENARVAVGGTDLDKSLIQYPGTAQPGDPGAPVIFGHSVLRQFYNPSEKNSRRYVSIFSTIMTLKPGDEIFVTHGGVKYKYVMREKTEVKPEDVHILTQNYDAKQLKLVTCTPEGTYLRRGVVTAQLVTSDEKE